MGIGSLAEGAGVKQVLGEACARNASGEVHYLDADSEFRTARLRFLQIDDRVLYTDQPQNIDGGVDLQSGQRVTVYVQLDQTRWAFDTRVNKCLCLVRLNRQRRVLGMALRLPGSIRNEQRRRDYRVSVVSHNIVCQIAPELTATPYACAIDSPRFQGTLQNVSSHGLRAVAYCPPGQMPSRGNRLFLTFTLPGVDDEFVVLANICHLRRVAARESIVLGLRIQPLPTADGGAIFERLDNFAMAQQRRMLRRRK